MRLRIFPEDDGVLQDLVQLAEQVQEGVRCCSELLAAQHERVFELRELAEAIDTRVTDLHFGILTTARTTYVLPLPRSDLYALSDHLARAAEHLVLAAESLASSELRGHQSTYTTEQLATVSRMASLSRPAMANLSSLDGLDEYWYDLHRLRKQSDRTHERHRLELFERLPPAEAFQHLMIADQLYDSARAMAQLAHEVGRITVSEA